MCSRLLNMWTAVPTIIYVFRMGVKQFLHGKERETGAERFAIAGRKGRETGASRPGTEGNGPENRAVMEL